MTKITSPQDQRVQQWNNQRCTIHNLEKCWSFLGPANWSLDSGCPKTAFRNGQPATGLLICNASISNAESKRLGSECQKYSCLGSPSNASEYMKLCRQQHWCQKKIYPFLWIRTTQWRFCFAMSLKESERAHKSPCHTTPIHHFILLWTKMSATERGEDNSLDNTAISL